MTCFLVPRCGVGTTQLCRGRDQPLPFRISTGDPALNTLFAAIGARRLYRALDGDRGSNQRGRAETRVEHTRTGPRIAKPRAEHLGDVGQ